MKRKINIVLSLLMLISLLLSACATATETPVPAVQEPSVEEPAVQEPVEEPTVEPTETPEVEEPEEVMPPDLDAAFGAMLSEMKAYNTINAETLLTELVEEGWLSLPDAVELADAIMHNNARQIFNLAEKTKALQDAPWT